MSLESEKQTEAGIDRALKALPELRAPSTLVLRVLRAIEARANLPWFKRAWQSWPTSLRVISFLVLASAFAGLCFAGWEASNAGSTLAAQKLATPLAAASALWSALQALISAAVVAFKGLGTGFLIGCVTAAVLGYALCLALGAAFLGLGLSLREK